MDTEQKETDTANGQTSALTEGLGLPSQATPQEELRRQIMSLTVPKNEREHWAARRIKLLETALNTAMTSLKQISETPRNAGARRNASATVKFLQTQGIDD